jgi:hypothetical protein
VALLLKKYLPLRKPKSSPLENIFFQKISQNLGDPENSVAASSLRGLFKQYFKNSEFTESVNKMMIAFEGAHGEADRRKLGECLSAILGNDRSGRVPSSLLPPPSSLLPPPSSLLPPPSSLLPR